MKPKRMAIRTLVAAGLAAVCLPLAFVLTPLLLPLWSWIEGTYGIESVGHSGPADWCYWLVYVVLASGSGAAILLFGREQRS